MSNILRVTTPVAGYDNTNNVKTGPVTTSNPSIQAPVNPEKVMRPDARSDSAAEEANVGLKFQYDSNFDNFIQQLQKSPSMVEEFHTLIFEKLGTMAQSGIRENFAEEISRFFSMIQLSPDEMMSFVKNQGDAAIRYKGAFFELLRQAMRGTASVELKAGILDFVKRYTDMAEGRHIMENIRQTLGQIKEQMFQSAKEKIGQMEQGIKYSGQPNGETAENSGILKEKILPFLNEYISKTHDRGGVREKTALLAALTARYENGDGQRLMDAFEELMKYNGMQKYFRGIEPSSLMQILANTEFEKASRKNIWMDQLAEIIKEGAGGAAGTENKQVFRELMKSFLLNESVYMPVLHMMLPMQVDGKLMFGEMWVDPNAGNEEAEGPGEGKLVRGLVKFDIRDVGFFDLYFAYYQGKVSLQLNYPEGLKTEKKEIENGIGRILAENGLQAEELVFGNSKESITLSEAFPQIFERRNSINVRI